MSLRAQGRYLLKTLVFWWTLFNVGRLVFMLYFFERYSHQGIGDWVNVFRHALRLDLSTAGYVMLVPLVMSTVALFAGEKFLSLGDMVYRHLIVALFAVTTVSDIGIYNAWGTKLNARAIGFLAYPKEAAASIEPRLLVALTAIGIGLFVFAFFWHRLLFRRNGAVTKARPRWYVVPPVFVVYLFANVLMIRGGLQQIPVNESAAYFSTDQRLNHAAVNTAWYVLHSLFENRENSRREMFSLMPEEQAQRITDELVQAGSFSASVSALRVQRPNVVFIQLESFTADVVAALGGEPGVTPNLDSMIARGLLFDRVYATGFRTDQGLVSLLCAFPAQPTASIIKQADKVERMPNLARTLKESGYHTSFHYGGELAFGNIQAFLKVSGFEKQSSVDDYPKSERNAKWGAHDEHVLRKHIVDLKHMPQPFFAYVMTLSSHEPFDVPGPPAFNGQSDAERFKNSCAYTDRCLGDYFARVQNESWYANTLFVLCADHGHALPRDRPYNRPERFHIPLLFFGPALDSSFVGKRIGTIGSQVDVAATLLHMLGLPDSSFYWSTSLLDTNRNSFAYYSFDDGVGLVTPQSQTGYFFRNDQTIYFDGEADSLTSVNQCKAYLQTLMRRYESY